MANIGAPREDETDEGIDPAAQRAARQSVGKSQRTKGATYEREIVHKLREWFGAKVERNIGQARDGGNDVDFFPLVLECKRRKSLKTLMGWLTQAVDATLAKSQATELGGQLIPVVVAREDENESVVILRLTDFLDLAGSEIEGRRQFFVSTVGKQP